MYVCLSVFVSVCLSVYLHVCLSVFVSVLRCQRAPVIVVFTHQDKVDDADRKGICEQLVSTMREKFQDYIDVHQQVFCLDSRQAKTASMKELKKVISQCRQTLFEVCAPHDV